MESHNGLDLELGWYFLIGIGSTFGGILCKIACSLGFLLLGLDFSIFFFIHC